MALNSRAKGKRGELEICRVLAERFGWRCRRTQQYSGHAGDADIVCSETPSLFLEVKRVEKLNVASALLKAVRQAGRRCPVLLHRQSRTKLGWLVTVRLEDLPRLTHAYTCADDEQVTTPTAVAAAKLPGADSDSREGRA